MPPTAKPPLPLPPSLELTYSLGISGTWGDSGDAHNASDTRTRRTAGDRNRSDVPAAVVVVVVVVASPAGPAVRTLVAVVAALLLPAPEVAVVVGAGLAGDGDGTDLPLDHGNTSKGDPSACGESALWVGEPARFHIPGGLPGVVRAAAAGAALALPPVFSLSAAKHHHA